jgi:hypothetical protein
MPSMDPPHGVLAAPRCVDLSAGTFLWRVGAPSGPLFSRRRPGVDREGIVRGGRFDPTAETSFTYLYVALDDLTALGETLLRDVAHGSDRRYVPSRKLTGRHLTLLEITRELRLASLLEARDLAAVRQDTWLVHAEQHAYPSTRRWGHWIRGDDATVQGLVWPSKRNPSGRAILLFGDRCAGAVRRTGLERPLDTQQGTAWLNRRLVLLNTMVAT